MRFQHPCAPVPAARMCIAQLCESNTSFIFIVNFPLFMQIMRYPSTIQFNWDSLHVQKTLPHRICIFGFCGLERISTYDLVCPSCAHAHVCVVLIRPWVATVIPLLAKISWISMKQNSCATTLTLNVLVPLNTSTC